MATVLATTRFPAQHEDFVHDLSYDYYGKRLATASSDNTLKIWSRKLSDDQQQAAWHLESTVDVNRGPVLGVAWANPDFGALIATSSLDRSIALWEEEFTTANASASAPPAAAGGSMVSKWRRLAVLTDHKDAVTSLSFAPKQFGLLLATSCGDGMIRLFQASDPGRTNWVLADSFRAGEGVPGGPDALAVGGEVSSLAWNTYRHDESMCLVAGLMSPPSAAVWRFDVRRKKWRLVASLAEHRAGVTSVAWAPNFGRSYHLLATASSDGTVKIWKLTAPGGSSSGDLVGSENSSLTLAAECVETLSHNGFEVWRVEFNVTGTSLATSADDGIVRVWAPNLKGKWVLQSELDSASSHASGGGTA